MTFTQTKGIEVEEEERFRRKFSFKKLYHMPHSQMKEKLVSGGARNQDLPGSKMWTQEDQVGNYDKTL